MVIKQTYFPAEFPDGPENFNKICKKLTQSRNFRKFTFPDKMIFTEHFREPGEVARTFEMREAVEVLNLDLIETKLSGKLRLLVTIYRTGFIVLSFVHSVIPKRKEGQPKGKNLTPEKPLNSLDLIFLVEGRISTHADAKSLKYEVLLENQKHEMGAHDLAEYLLKHLEAHGIMVRRDPKKNTNLIHCWNPNFAAFPKLLEESYEDLFLIFTTPIIEPSQKTKEDKLKQLKAHMLWSSEDRCILFRAKTMLIISPVFQEPNRLLFGQLPWLFQLASIQSFMLQFYSRELRRLAFNMSAMISRTPARLLSQVFRLMSAFSLSLEDLYWVESDLFRMQSARFITEYKKRFKLDEKLASLQKRFAWIKERCTEAMETLQERAEKEREKSITYLTLIFATFGLGEILSSFVIWYFIYLQSNAPPIPNFAIAIGLSAPFLAICLLYFVSRWYVTNRYKET